MKSTYFSYLIFVNDAYAPLLKNFSRLNDDHESILQTFIKGYTNCFAETNRVELPPSRGENDHTIDLILDTT